MVSNDEGDLEETVKSIKSDVNAIKENLDKLCTDTKDTAVPIGLKIAFQETFRCKICLNMMSPPIIIIFKVLQIAHWL